MSREDLEHGGGMPLPLLGGLPDDDSAYHGKRHQEETPASLTHTGSTLPGVGWWWYCVLLGTHALHTSWGSLLPPSIRKSGKCMPPSWGTLMEEESPAQAGWHALL